MSIISNFIDLFQRKNILVNIDPVLLPYLDTFDKISTTRIISFSLFNLIYHIGAIQTRRFATSNRMKFLDKMDLVEKILNNTNEFQIKINEIRLINGSETLTSISEDFGVGISVVVAENLFDIKSSTIQRIYGTGKRPDWKCQTVSNRILVVECKGSTSVQTSNLQEINALIQKTKEPGDIQVASLTLLNEGVISSNRFLDPPIETSNKSPIMENHILRAGHYATVFSFLGNSKLSRYYSQMRKRLEGLITPFEQGLKDKTFRTLNSRDPRVTFNNKIFVGSFYSISIDEYLFVGVDADLISYEGFINFPDYQDDLEVSQNGNHYLLYKDGILLIEIRNINFFEDVVNIAKIKNYQDKITISDIDEMNEISFAKYFIRVLEQNNFRDIVEQNLNNNIRSDLTATYDDIVYYFEFKLFKGSGIRRNIFEDLNRFSFENLNERLILVTNERIENIIQFNLAYSVIDRKRLELLVKNSKLLLEFI